MKISKYCEGKNLSELETLLIENDNSKELIQIPNQQDKLDDIREHKFDWFLTPQECIDLGVVDDWIANEPQEDDKN